MRADRAGHERALRPVLADLERQHPGLLRVETTDADPDCSVWLWEADGSGAGLRDSDALAGAEAIVDLADRVQEVVCEALWSVGQPATWPDCPEHPASHPLSPLVVQEEPVWVCPRSNRPVARVGTLPAAR